MASEQREKQLMELFAKLNFEFNKNPQSAETKRLKKQIGKMGAAIIEVNGRLRMLV